MTPTTRQAVARAYIRLSCAHREVVGRKIIRSPANTAVGVSTARLTNATRLPDRDGHGGDRREPGPRRIGRDRGPRLQQQVERPGRGVARRDDPPQLGPREPRPGHRDQVLVVAVGGVPVPQPVDRQRQHAEDHRQPALDPGNRRTRIVRTAARACRDGGGSHRVGGPLEYPSRIGAAVPGLVRSDGPVVDATRLGEWYGTAGSTGRWNEA